MTVTNSLAYAIGLIVVSLALLAFAFVVKDPSIRGIVVGALVGYWFREGTAVVARNKPNDT